MAPYSILKNCSSFIGETPPTPLYKCLPKHGDGFRRVKVRKKAKHEYNYEKFLDDSFKHERENLRLRSVLAHTVEPEITNPDEEIFFIFPPDGYRVLFSVMVNDHKAYLNELTKTIAESPTVDLLLKSVFRSAYKTGSIKEAAVNKSDVVIYNIQNYYAIRKSIIVDYSDFIMS